jgi:PhzF family phenazine biosynthesis protein
MKIKIFQVDAFTDHQFGGNPAAICPLDAWLPDTVMQLIAMENNLAETAFLVPEGEIFHIRWFTPEVEVDLCGHATLASAFVIFNKLNYKGETINFSSRSGYLSVRKNGDLLTLDFPRDSFSSERPSPALINSFGVHPIEAYKGKTDWMFLLGSQKEVEDFIPDLTAMSKIDARGIIITAKGDDVDFVSRFFAPQAGIPEDPVTGSAHTTLAPFWAEKLGKTELSALQLSRRKGHLWCKVAGDRIEISGQARLYMSGEINIEREE